MNEKVFLVMGKDFSSLSESQKMRDNSILDEIHSEYVAPLIDELCSLIPNYSSMDDRSKFVQLLLLNEEFALNGDWLQVDFGYMSDMNRAIAAFYSGEQSHYYQEWDGVKAYIPYYVSADEIGVPLNPLMPFWASIPNYTDEGRKSFDALPICFRIAVIARTIQQNLLVTLRDACRYAAGFDTELTLKRFRVRAYESSEMQRFGWCVDIRDTSPENELMLKIAGDIRLEVKSHEGKQYSCSPLYTETDKPRKRRRTRHESTEKLIAFVDIVLPGRGYYVGRKGKGERLSWDSAYSMFCEEFPGIYNSVKSFRDSYYNAKKARSND